MHYFWQRGILKRFSSVDESTLVNLIVPHFKFSNSGAYWRVSLSLAIFFHSIFIPCKSNICIVTQLEEGLASKREREQGEYCIRIFTPLTIWYGCFWLEMFNFRPKQIFERMQCEYGIIFDGLLKLWRYTKSNYFDWLLVLAKTFLHSQNAKG